MIWIIIEFLFPALLIALPLTLYRSNRPLMTKFYLRMTASGSAQRKRAPVFITCRTSSRFPIG